MRISVAKETADGEKRVLLLPEEVGKLTDRGHEVIVEKNAGLNIHRYDRNYMDAGARVVSDRKELFGDTDMLVKLKSPTPQEFDFLNNNILFSMLHHSQNPKNVYHLGKRGATAIEIESIFNDAGERLVDGTDMTGEVGVLYAVQHLQKMPQDATALILGYGRVGSGAINMCGKLGIKTKILRREEYSDITHFLKGKDLLINAIAWPEEARENERYVVTKEMIDLLDKAAVVLDLSVDFPNPIQTCRPTGLSNPFYIEEGRVHIGIYGYPGLVPMSSTKRYSGQVLPLISEIAKNNGLEGLAERGDLGRFLAKAVVDPEELNWRQYEPEELTGSLIE